MVHANEEEINEVVSEAIESEFTVKEESRRELEEKLRKEAPEI